MSYRISAPDEYLAITGMGIRTVKITKAAWVWPLQRCTRFSIQPQDYSMDLQAMTKEKLQFSLPVVFTVGPDVNQRGANSRAADLNAEEEEEVVNREDAGDALMKYAMLLAQSESPRNGELKNHVENIVKGIIEGETRVLVSSMTMEEIFTEREVFKRRIFRNIQSELSQFGLHIYNSNVCITLTLGYHPSSSSLTYIDIGQRTQRCARISLFRVSQSESPRKRN